MKATYRSLNGRITFEVEGATMQATIAELATAQEIVECANKCGLCNSPRVRFRVRDNNKGGYEFYEVVCDACSARLNIGKNAEGGGLFPKRTADDTHEFLPNFGWYKYVPPAPRTR